MTFSYTVNLKDAAGKGYVTGTYNNSGGSPTGIVTGLGYVEFFNRSPGTSSPGTGFYWTTSGGIVTMGGLASGETGYWFAIGI